MAKVPAKQPELLSRSENVALFGACTHPIHRMLLQTVYAAGLRVSEACALRVTDIDSAADCMCLRIASGKGDKGCYSILSPTLLAGLRVYVRSFRQRSWLFCSASHQVVFKVRANDHGDKRVVKLGGVEFVRRFLRHVLPKGIKRIRHYGLLAPSKARTRNLAREALQMPAVYPQALESAQDFMQRVAKVELAQCPCYQTGRLRLVQTLQGCRTLPAPLVHEAASRKARRHHDRALPGPLLVRWFLVAWKRRVGGGASTPF